MNEQQKQQIAERLQNYCDRIGSQNKAANTLKNVSTATINHVLNGKWDQITDEMWRHIGAQIGHQKFPWATVETRDMKMLNFLLEDARENSLVFAVVGDAGTGKTVALRQFTEENKGVYLLQCNEFWNRKYFLQELIAALGRDYAGYTTGEMMHEIVTTLKKREKPLIILDEADKLSDQVMYFFITLYNNLEDHCGIVLCATNHLAKRIQRGRKLNKKGYNEIFSRIGRRFIELQGISTADVTAICMANGLTEAGKIREVMEECENDLRRVKRKVHALKNA
jgi:Uncharacterized ATPase, putative transposase